MALCCKESKNAQCSCILCCDVHIVLLELPLLWPLLCAPVLCEESLADTGNIFPFHPLAVGNKNDSPDRKVVLTEDAQRFSDQMGIRLFETSAKDNINVDEVCDRTLDT